MLDFIELGLGHEAFLTVVKTSGCYHSLIMFFDIDGMGQ